MPWHERFALWLIYTIMPSHHAHHTYALCISSSMYVLWYEPILYDIAYRQADSVYFLFYTLWHSCQTSLPDSCGLLPLSFFLLLSVSRRLPAKKTFPLLVTYYSHTVSKSTCHAVTAQTHSTMPSHYFTQPFAPAPRIAYKRRYEIIL